jgi:hypothetical protein
MILTNTLWSAQWFHLTKEVTAMYPIGYRLKNIAADVIKKYALMIVLTSACLIAFPTADAVESESEFVVMLYANLPFDGGIRKSRQNVLGISFDHRRPRPVSSPLISGLATRPAMLDIRLTGKSMRSLNVHGVDVLPKIAALNQSGGTKSETEFSALHAVALDVGVAGIIATAIVLAKDAEDVKDAKPACAGCEFWNSLLW